MGPRPGTIRLRNYPLRTVLFELDGETHDLSVAVAEQLSRDLDAAIETLRSDQDEDVDSDDADYEPDDEFVDVLTTVEDVGPIIAERLEGRFGSLEDVVDASEAELETVDGLGPKGIFGIRDLSAESDQ